MCRSARIIIALAIIHSTVTGQPSKVEITTPASPATDTIANNPSVPDVYSITGQFERVVILRFKHQTDLLAGLNSMITKDNIRNAVILAGAGSVRGYHFHVVSNRTFPSRNIFVRDSTAPADIAGMNGYVIDGRVHAHITFSDADKAFGGHLEPGTEVFTFAIVTLGILKDGTDLRRTDDQSYR